METVGRVFVIKPGTEVPNQMQALRFLPLFLSVALACKCPTPPSREDCIWDPVSCYKMTLDHPAGSCMCWPLDQPPVTKIDTRTCGRRYLNITRLLEHPCQDRYDENCVPMVAYFNGEFWYVPNPWDPVDDINTELVELGWKSKLVSMTAEAFCNPSNWNS